MQREGQFVLGLYLLLLLVLVISKIIRDVSIIDVSYLIVLLCSIFKMYLIARKERK